MVISGSESDYFHVEKINNELKKLGIFYHNYYHSAHKETMTVLKIIKEYEVRDKVVYVTVAGLSNALGGVVASNTKHPVINCPPFKDQTDIQFYIISSIVGDVNGDSEINIFDVMETISIILNNSGYLFSADLNQDQTIDVFDIIEIINIILSANF